MDKWVLSGVKREVNADKAENICMEGLSPTETSPSILTESE
jgi:hypothetical protein